MRLLISSEQDLEVVWEAQTGEEAVDVVENLKPDLLLLDLDSSRTDWLEVSRETKRRCPGVKVIVLTVHDREERILTSLQAGANGCILKNAAPAELLMAIRRVLGGSAYLGEGKLEIVPDAYLKAGKTRGIAFPGASDQS